MADRVRICPRCGSTRLKEAKTSLSGWLVPSSYYCENCKYAGQVYVEVEAEEIDRFQRTINGS